MQIDKVQLRIDEIEKNALNPCKALRQELMQAWEENLTFMPQLKHCDDRTKMEVGGCSPCRTGPNEIDEQENVAAVLFEGTNVPCTANEGDKDAGSGDVDGLAAGSSLLSSTRGEGTNGEDSSGDDDDPSDDCGDGPNLCVCLCVCVLVCVCVFLRVCVCASVQQAGGGS